MTDVKTVTIELELDDHISLTRAADLFGVTIEDLARSYVLLCGASLIMGMANPEPMMDFLATESGVRLAANLGKYLPEGPI